METSPTTAKLTEAIMTFHRVATIIGKNSQNPAFKSGPNGSASKYASLAHILSGIAEPLAEADLCFVQFPDGDGLTTRLMHVSGEWMQASQTLRPVQNTPQAHGSAITYAKRYALVAILGLRIDGDDDGNAASQPAPKRDATAMAGEYWAALAELADGHPIKTVWNRYPGLHTDERFKAAVVAERAARH